jgi:phosphatidylglycerol:prolipoprotein diacylglycerol transferase
MILKEGVEMSNLLSIPRGFYIGGMEIRFYGILMALAMAVGVILACYNAKARGMKSDHILILACYVLPLAVIGARMFSFFSERSLYSSFWQIFNLRTGGMSIFGGIIGGAVAILLFCLIHKKNFFAVADVVVPSLILGQAIGRWGNFFNQEVYGFEVTNPSLQWFPFSVYIEATGTWHLATFFYEFVFNMLLFLVLMLMLRKFKVKRNGVLMATYLVWYGVVRACLEPLRIQKYILYMGKIRVSLFVSIICAVLGVAYFVYLLVDYLLKKKKQTLAGVTSEVNVEVQAASETIEDKQDIPKGLEQTSKEESETPEENKTDKKA